ncbi:hypothetical protein D3C78_734010 [compost metagenome]
MPLDVLDHDDRIVDDDTDRKYQAEQRQGIERETHQVHDRKGADKRHRHGHQGDERGPPAAQEHHHHDHDEKDRFQQGCGYRFERGAHEDCRVIGDPRAQPCREVAFKPLYGFPYRLGNIECVGTRTLNDLQCHRWLAVQQTAQCIGIAAHLDAGDITQARHLTVVAGADDDVAELLLVAQAPEGIHRDLKGSSGVRRLANRAGGHLHVLFAYRGNHLPRRQPTCGDQVRIEPQAHAVFTSSPHQHIADARETGQFIAHLQVGVVRDIEGIVAFVGRQQVHHHQNVR